MAYSREEKCLIYVEDTSVAEQILKDLGFEKDFVFGKHEISGHCCFCSFVPVEDIIALSELLSEKGIFSQKGSTYIYPVAYMQLRRRL